MDLSLPLVSRAFDAIFSLRFTRMYLISLQMFALALFSPTCAWAMRGGHRAAQPASHAQTYPHIVWIKRISEVAQALTGVS